MSTASRAFNLSAAVRAVLASITAFFALLRSSLVQLWQAITGRGDRRAKQEQKGGEVWQEQAAAQVAWERPQGSQPSAAGLRGAGRGAGTNVEGAAAAELQAAAEGFSAARGAVAGAPAGAAAAGRANALQQRQQAAQQAAAAAAAVEEEEQELQFDRLILEQEKLTVRELKARMGSPTEEGAPAAAGNAMAEASIAQPVQAPAAANAGGGAPARAPAGGAAAAAGGMRRRRGEPAAAADPEVERQWRRQQWLKRQAELDAPGDVQYLDGRWRPDAGGEGLGY